MLFFIVLPGTAGAAHQRSVAPYTTSLSEGREKKPWSKKVQTAHAKCANHHTILVDLENFSRFQTQEKHNASYFNKMSASPLTVKPMQIYTLFLNYMLFHLIICGKG